MITTIRIFVLSMCVGLLYACMDNNEYANGVSGSGGGSMSMSQVAPRGSLKQTDFQTSEAYFKQQMNEHLDYLLDKPMTNPFANVNPYDPVLISGGGTENDGASMQALATNTPAYSITNLIEQGVDESDVVKTDGKYIYSLVSDSVRIYELQVTGKPNLINTLELEQGVYGSELYLMRDQLVVLSNTYVSGAISTVLTLVDVANPQTARVLKQATLNASYSVTRRNGNILLVADSEFFDVYNEWFDYAENNHESSFADQAVRAFSTRLSPSTEPRVFDLEMWSNFIKEMRTKVANTPISDYLPTYHIDGRVVSFSGCFYNDTQNLPDEEPLRFLSVFSLNPDNLELTASACLPKYQATRDNYYVSAESIYFFTEFNASESTSDHPWVWERPDSVRIERFSYAANSLNYNGSAEVEGAFPRAGNINFYMSEYQQHLRLFTDAGTRDEPNTRLHVLKLEADSLNSVATLPNEQNPKAIGKPGEVAYGARFVGDKAYLITGIAQLSDPFITFDLSNPVAPRIIGELDVLSFASYLHPINDDLIVAVGRNNDEVDIRLFDVSNDVAIELDRFSPGEGWVDVRSDHKSMCSVRVSDTETRLALLMSGYPSQSVQPFAVHKVANSYKFSVGKALPLKEPNTYGSRRCLIIDTSLYGVYGDSMHWTKWYQ